MSPGGNLLSLRNQAPATRGSQGVGTRSTGASSGSQGVIVRPFLHFPPFLELCILSLGDIECNCWFLVLHVAPGLIGPCL